MDRTEHPVRRKPQCAKSSVMQFASVFASNHCVQADAVTQMVHKQADDMRNVFMLPLSTTSCFLDVYTRLPRGVASQAARHQETSRQREKEVEKSFGLKEESYRKAIEAAVLGKASADSKLQVPKLAGHHSYNALGVQVPNREQTNLSRELS